MRSTFSARIPIALPGSTASAVVIVFARAPIPGAAKTRLIPRMGAWRAARLHARLAAHAVRVARGAARTVEVHVTPGTRHAFFRRLQALESIRLERQRGRDLGQRMRSAFERGLRRHRFVILIGTDCPVLAPRDLRRALRLLRAGTDAVLAPAEDGGYALIGLRRLRGGIFEGIAWGGDAVLRDTLAKMQAAGLRARLLRRVWDVDRAADLERLDPLRDLSRARRAG